MAYLADHLTEVGPHDHAAGLRQRQGFADQHLDSGCHYIVVGLFAVDVSIAIESSATSRGMSSGSRTYNFLK
jgi:hypothetical protein